MIRRKEREFALKVLYAVEYNDSSIEEQMGYLKQSEPDFATDFSKNLIKTYIDNKDQLDALIKEKLKHWKFDRVAVIDKILLRMALVEFLYFEDIPPKVTIDEIIEDELLCLFVNSTGQPWPWRLLPLQLQGCCKPRPTRTAPPMNLKPLSSPRVEPSSEFSTVPPPSVS